jgi:hypothetical protein
MSAFTLIVRAKPLSAPQILSGLSSHLTATREMNPRKAKSRQPLIAEWKALRATEDRDRNRSACAAQSGTEVMHPKLISRELAQENQDRPGIA